MKSYEYEAHICNNIIYGSLVQILASGVDDEDISVMLNCIGKTFITMSYENKPIEYYMKNYEQRRNIEGEKKDES